MTGDALKAEIRAEALRRGFVLCGFAPLQPPPHAEFLQRWLAEGNAAGMGYLGKGLAKRLDPTLILRGTRTMITLAFPYAPPPIIEGDWRSELRGRIAAYAAGPDYHDVVRERLDEVGGAIRALVPAARTLTYVDTGAILEREWATLGSVGWFGKNTMILHRLHGSWFFLGEILTDLELEPEPLVSDHCGTCRRCLDDCPTGALRGDYVLDARLCISYLTIEHRGPIPPEIRPQMANWIFGCDVCQEVCPWNRGAQPAEPNEVLQPRLLELFALDEATFDRRFRHTALWRTKREGLLRNIAVALGNSGNREAVAALAQALGNESSPLIRGHAAWALGELGGEAALRALDTARGDADEYVRGEVERALDR